MTDTDPPWFVEYQKRCQQAQVDAQAAIAAPIDRLAELRITTVQLAYDGYGDSGAIESVEARDEGGALIDLPGELREALIAAGETLLPCGWENNDGAFGELVLDVKKRRLARQHNWRVESTDYEEESWSL